MKFLKPLAVLCQVAMMLVVLYQLLVLWMPMGRWRGWGLIVPGLCLYGLLKTGPAPDWWRRTLNLSLIFFLVCMEALFNSTATPPTLLGSTPLLALGLVGSVCTMLTVWHRLRAGRKPEPPTAPPPTAAQEG